MGHSLVKAVDFYLSKPMGQARNVLFYDSDALGWRSLFMRSESIIALAIRERRIIAYTTTAPEFIDAPGPFIPLAHRPQIV